MINELGFDSTFSRLESLLIVIAVTFTDSESCEAAFKLVTDTLIRASRDLIPTDVLLGVLVLFISISHIFHDIIGTVPKPI